MGLIFPCGKEAFGIWLLRKAVFEAYFFWFSLIPVLRVGDFDAG